MNGNNRNFRFKVKYDNGNIVISDDDELKNYLSSYYNEKIIDNIERKLAYEVFNDERNDQIASEFIRGKRGEIDVEFDKSYLDTILSSKETFEKFPIIGIYEKDNQINLNLPRYIVESPRLNDILKEISTHINSTIGAVSPELRKDNILVLYTFPYKKLYREPFLDGVFRFWDKVASRVPGGGVLQSGLSGATNALRATEEMFRAYGAKWVADVISTFGVSEDMARKLAERRARKGDEAFVKEMVMSTPDIVAENIVYMALTMGGNAVGAVAGGAVGLPVAGAVVGGAIPAFFLEGGGALEEALQVLLERYAKEKGVPLSSIHIDQILREKQGYEIEKIKGQAVVIASLVGLVNAVLESYSGGSILLGRRWFQSQLKREGFRKFVHLVAELGDDALKEGITEALQEANTYLSSRKFKNININELGQRIIEAFYGGAVLGSSFGGARVAITHKEIERYDKLVERVSAMRGDEGQQMLADWQAVKSANPSNPFLTREFREFAKNWGEYLVKGASQVSPEQVVSPAIEESVVGRVQELPEEAQEITDDIALKEIDDILNGLNSAPPEVRDKVLSKWEELNDEDLDNAYKAELLRASFQRTLRDYREREYTEALSSYMNLGASNEVERSIIRDALSDISRGADLSKYDDLYNKAVSFLNNYHLNKPVMDLSEYLRGLVNSGLLSKKEVDSYLNTAKEFGADKTLEKLKQLYDDKLSERIKAVNDLKDDILNSSLPEEEQAELIKILGDKYDNLAKTRERFKLLQEKHLKEGLAKREEARETEEEVAEERKEEQEEVKEQVPEEKEEEQVPVEKEELVEEEEIERPQEKEKEKVERVEKKKKEVSPVEEETKERDIVPIKEIDIEDDDFYLGRVFESEALARLIRENWKDYQDREIVLWRDPKTGKRHLISGYPIYLAFKELVDKGEVKDGVKVRYFRGTRAQAIAMSEKWGDFAYPSDMARIFREAREKGRSIKLSLKPEEYDYYRRLSYLNPKGKLLRALDAIQEGDEAYKGLKSYLMRVAGWMGDFRSRVDIDDDMEDRMYDYLLENKIKKESDLEEVLGEINRRAQAEELARKEESKGKKTKEKGVETTKEKPVALSNKEEKSAKVEMEKEEELKTEETERELKPQEASSPQKEIPPPEERTLDDYLTEEQRKQLRELQKELYNRAIYDKSIRKEYPLKRVKININEFGDDFQKTYRFIRFDRPLVEALFYKMISNWKEEKDAWEEILVWRDPDDGKYYVLSGFAKYFAYRKLYDEGKVSGDISVYIFEGNREKVNELIFILGSRFKLLSLVDLHLFAQNKLKNPLAIHWKLWGHTEHNKEMGKVFEQIIAGWNFLNPRGKIAGLLIKWDLNPDTIPTYDRYFFTINLARYVISYSQLMKRLSLEEENKIYDYMLKVFEKVRAEYKDDFSFFKEVYNLDYDTYFDNALKSLGEDYINVYDKNLMSNIKDLQDRKFFEAQYGRIFELKSPMVKDLSEEEIKIRLSHYLNTLPPKYIFVFSALRRVDQFMQSIVNRYPDNNNLKNLYENYKSKRYRKFVDYSSELSSLKDSISKVDYENLVNTLYFYRYLEDLSDIYTYFSVPYDNYYYDDFWTAVDILGDYYLKIRDKSLEERLSLLVKDWNDLPEEGKHMYRDYLKMVDSIIKYFDNVEKLGKTNVKINEILKSFKEMSFGNYLYGGVPLPVPAVELVLKYIQTNVIRTYWEWKIHLESEVHLNKIRKMLAENNIFGIKDVDADVLLDFWKKNFGDNEIATLPTTNEQIKITLAQLGVDLGKLTIDPENLLKQAVDELNADTDGFLAGVMEILSGVKDKAPQEWGISPLEQMKMYVALSYLERWTIENGERIRNVFEQYKGRRLNDEMLQNLYVQIVSNDEAIARSSMYLLLLYTLHRLGTIESKAFSSRIKDFWTYRLKLLNEYLASVKDPVFRDVMMRHAEMWRRVAETKSERERLEFLLGELDKHKERIKELEKQIKVLEEVNKVLKEQTKGKERGKGKGGGIRMGIADVVKGQDILQEAIKRNMEKKRARVEELRNKGRLMLERFYVSIMGIDIAIEYFNFFMELLYAEIDYYMALTGTALRLSDKKILDYIKKENVPYPPDWSDELMLELIRRAKLNIISDLLKENNIPHKFNIETGEFELLTSLEQLKSEIEKEGELMSKTKEAVDKTIKKKITKSDIYLARDKFLETGKKEDLYEFIANDLSYLVEKRGDLRVKDIFDTLVDDLNRLHKRAVSLGKAFTFNEKDIDEAIEYMRAKNYKSMASYLMSNMDRLRNSMKSLKVAIDLSSVPDILEQYNKLMNILDEIVNNDIIRAYPQLVKASHILRKRFINAYNDVYAGIMQKKMVEKGQGDGGLSDIANTNIRAGLRELGDITTQGIEELGKISESIKGREDEVAKRYAEWVRISEPQNVIDKIDTATKEKLYWESKSTFTKTILTINDFLKTMLTIFDLSIPFMQSFLITIRHPVVSIQMLLQSIEVLVSPEKYNQLIMYLASNPYTIEMKKLVPDSLPDISDPFKAFAMFGSPVLNKFKHFSKLRMAIGRMWGIYFNALRVLLYENFVRLNPQATEIDKKEFIAHLMLSSGQPNRFRHLYYSINKHINLSLFFFSASFLLQRIEYLVHYNPVSAIYKTIKGKRKSYLVHKYILKQALLFWSLYLGFKIFSFLATGLRSGQMPVLLTFKEDIKPIEKFLKLHPEVDPRQVDFCAIRIGNTRIGIPMGMGSLARMFLMTILTLPFFSPEIQTKELPFHILMRNLIYRTSPLFNLALAGLYGKSVVGEEITMSEFIIKTMYPIWLQDIWNAVNDPTNRILYPGLLIYLISSLSFFGFPVQTFMKSDEIKRYINWTIPIWIFKDVGISNIHDAVEFMLIHAERVLKQNGHKYLYGIETKDGVRYYKNKEDIGTNKYLDDDEVKKYNWVIYIYRGSTPPKSEFIVNGIKYKLSNYIKVGQIRKLGSREKVYLLNPQEK